uniref:Uncharacterized protein n=1 Tax=Anguilla anguilla TaxID=7936 RepID=A0A0E9T1I6_ANGAN
MLMADISTTPLGGDSTSLSEQ